MNTIEARTTLDVLDRDECLRLLAYHHLGRPAVVVDDQPLVFPVNDALASHSVVFRTDPGTKLYAANGHRVAFEIDGTDAQYHEGWSVLVVGTAHEELEPTRLRDIARLPLGPWSSGASAHWMRISTSAITGRPITHSAHT